MPRDVIIQMNIKTNLINLFIQFLIYSNLLQCLKDRTGTKVLGFYVSPRKRIDNYAMDKYFSYRDRSKVHSQMRKDKVVDIRSCPFFINN